MAMINAAAVQPPTIDIPKNNWWNKGKPLVGIFVICALDARIVYLTKLQIDLLTGVALITFLFM
ncbi:MAG: hypothetical protein WBF14_04980, partial [Candidatus Acidiferrales bacterium]